MNINTLFLSLKRFISSPTARRLVLATFVIQAIFLVFTVRLGTNPDENNHSRFIEFYASHSLGPVFNHQTPTSNLGDKTREVDYLYHYTMSLVMRVLPFSNVVELHIIRLFSVVFGLSTLIILARILKKVGVSAGVITVSFLLVTNLPMVLMMSSAVNNDTLVWLGMAAGIWLLLKLRERPKLTDLVWLANLVVFGGLIKRNLLALGLLFGVLGLLIAIRHRKPLVKQLKPLNWQLAAGLILLVIGVGLFAERIGGNIVRYHTIAATCDQVQGEEACRVFWANGRARDLASRPKPPQIPVFLFVPRWFDSSFYNVVDIQTQFWRHEVKPSRQVINSLYIVLLIGLAYGVYYEAKRFSSDQKSRLRVYIMLVLLYYVLVQLLTNYATYRHFGFFGIALNGRYIIPSLLPFVAFSCMYWTKLLEKHPKLLTLLVVIMVCTVVFGSGLHMMLQNPQLRRG